MKHRISIGILLVLVFTLQTTAFATNVRLVDADKKSFFGFLDFLKPKSPADAKIVNTEPAPTDAKELTAQAGTLTVIKDTPTQGTLAYTSVYPAEELDVTFTLGDLPTHGQAAITDAKTGAFSYTPENGYVGEDTFSFVVTDAAKTLSDTGIITVTVGEAATPSPSPELPPETKFRYEDMLGHWGEYSAIELAERGTFHGVNFGGKYYFYPDTEMTRGDFILYVATALQLNVADYEGVASPFADAAQIPLWISLPAKALFDADIIHGSAEDGELYLRPFDKLTRVEAITILNNSIAPQQGNVNKVDFADMYLVPEWAHTAIQNMQSYGILNGYDDNTFRPFVRVNRATASEILWQLVKYGDENPSMIQKIVANMDKTMQQ